MLTNKPADQKIKYRYLNKVNLQIKFFLKFINITQKIRFVYSTIFAH